MECRNLRVSSTNSLTTHILCFKISKNHTYNQIIHTPALLINLKTTNVLYLRCAALEMLVGGGKQNRPDDTPWEGGTFKLTLNFTEDYPNKPPVVKFVSRLFHPNVYNDGGICLDILQSNWSPIYDISAVLTSIQSLLCDPNPNSPANSEAARLFQENRREYNKRVQKIVEESWTS